MGANDRQIGGTHYQSPYQHWDMMDDYNIAYLEGYASKYLVRWRKSPKPIQDLEKSLHICEKILERYQQGRRRNYSSKIPLSVMDKFISVNDVEPERTPLQFLLCWPGADSTRQAIEFIRELLAHGNVTVETPEEPHYPGTPADGGHYERQRE